MTGIPTLDDIRAAARQIEGLVLRTPFLPAPRLSKLTGADIWVKYENLQATPSSRNGGLSSSSSRSTQPNAHEV
jgi:threonine dehydratase